MKKTNNNNAKPETPESKVQLIVDAELERNEAFQPWWSAMARPLEELLGFVPSVRDTRSGRSAARQTRIALVVIGVLVMALGQRPLWIVVGLTLMLLALVVPLDELKKRGWLGHVRGLRASQTRRVRSAASLVFDGRRIELREGTTMVRRVLVNRGTHEVELRRRGALVCLGILAPSRRKREAIWICASNARIDADTLAELDASEVDLPVHVASADWEQIYAALSPPARTLGP